MLTQLCISHSLSAYKVVELQTYEQTLGFLYDWFEERFQVQSIGDDILSKFVPAHVNIFYCFGGIVLTCFLVQAATGFGLTLFYRPTVLEAYTSVQFIVTDVNLGWLVRSMHRWSSGLMFLCLLLHVSRVYLTGGFKKPRELTWVSGDLSFFWLLNTLAWTDFYFHWRVLSQYQGTSVYKCACLLVTLVDTCLLGTVHFAIAARTGDFYSSVIFARGALFFLSPC